VLQQPPSPRPVYIFSEDYLRTQLLFNTNMLPLSLYQICGYAYSSTHVVVVKMFAPVASAASHWYLGAHTIVPCDRKVPVDEQRMDLCSCSSYIRFAAAMCDVARPQPKSWCDAALQSTLIGAPVAVMVHLRMSA